MAATFVVARGLKEVCMRLTTATLALAAIVIAVPSIASAQGSSQNAPGQQMQDRGSTSGSPGASGYAPGQQMQDKGSKPGTTGASGYAPGQQQRSTTGSNSGNGKNKSRTDSR
jgi:hypothetical protein